MTTHSVKWWQSGTGTTQPSYDHTCGPSVSHTCGSNGYWVEDYPYTSNPHQIHPNNEDRTTQALERIATALERLAEKSTDSA